MPVGAVVNAMDNSRDVPSSNPSKNWSFLPDSVCIEVCKLPYLIWNVLSHVVQFSRWKAASLLQRAFWQVPPADSPGVKWYHLFIVTLWPQAWNIWHQLENICQWICCFWVCFEFSMKTLQSIDKMCRNTYCNPLTRGGGDFSIGSAWRHWLIAVLLGVACCTRGCEHRL